MKDQMKFISTNFQILIKAQIEFMSEAKIGMTESELQKIAICKCSKYNIPFDLIQPERLNPETQ
jgi:antitoxin component of RelBE/YafQ-DinJ toxin-antitoxin module